MNLNLTPDESRALSFVAALLLLSAAVRVGMLPEPVEVPAGAAFDLDAHIEATARAVAEAERRDRPLGPGERIDPNTAPAAELARLPGVGESLAARIVEAREAGRFRHADDLTRVSGIGPRTVERLAPHLALESAPARGAVGAGPGAGPPADAPVNVNTAGVDALTTLPGVGPVLAARIIAHRDSAGRFPAVDSLLAVRGVGPATLERLRARVRVR